jgi:hypothetical protein
LIPKFTNQIGIGLTIAFAVASVFAQISDKSPELNAKALFYSATGEMTQVTTATPQAEPARNSDKQESRTTPKVGVTKRPSLASSPLALRSSVLLLSESGKLIETKPSHTFQTGDRVKLAFSASKSGYFYLATIGSSGKVQVLAPRPGEPAVIEAGNRYSFPSNPTGYFRFDSTKGREEIWAILSDEPLDAINMGGGLVAQLGTKPETSNGINPSILAGKSILDISSDLSSKDLVFEEDASALFASVKPHASLTNSKSKPPVVVKLLLQHH